MLSTANWLLLSLLSVTNECLAPSLCALPEADRRTLFVSPRFADLSAEEQSALLLEFFRRWKTQTPDLARKAAFDYIDGQKGFVALAFGVSLLFALPLAAGLLADSRSQFSCTKVLQENSTLGAMDVTKFKRKRKATIS